MADEQSSYTRRKFLRRGVEGACLLSLSGMILPSAGCDGEEDAPRGLGKRFEYDLSAYRHVDPALIAYEEGAPIATGMACVRGLTVDKAGIVYVCGDKALIRFGPDGQKQNAIALDGKPRCTAVDEEGLIYIAFIDHVEVYGADGRRRAQWSPAEGEPVFTSIAVTDSDVFVADAGNRAVYRYDKTGQLVLTMGEPKQFILPSPYFDVAMGADGLLRIANTGKHRIELYTVDGQLELQWGRFSTAIDGFCGCCNPAHFAMLPDGRTVTSEKGLPRVKVYSAVGELESVVVSPEALDPDQRSEEAEQRRECSSAAFDLAVNDGGRVHVLDPLTNSVRVFQPIERPAEVAAAGGETG